LLFLTIVSSTDTFSEGYSYIYEYEKQDDIKNLILDKAIEVQKEN